MRYLYFAPIFLIWAWISCSAPQTTDLPSVSVASLENRLAALADKAVADLETVALDSMGFPRSVNPDGSLHVTGSRSWTSGFYPGYLWQLYAYSQKPELKTAAQNWTAFIEKEKWDDHTHDLGFKLFCSFGQGWRLTGNSDYQDVFLQASKTLINRYNPTVGSIKSWDFNQEVWQFPVIIDNMMNLEMLFKATELSGDSTFYQVANDHAQTTLKNHFRPDNSSIHVIDYDTLTGEIRNRHTHQGAAHESAWARGQAWGLYGFTVAYRCTGDPAFLEQAKAIAQFFFQHPRLPEDKIPYWDFDAPDIPNEPRDVSAAAIAASALLELQKHDPDNASQYLAWADEILLSLEKADYQAQQAPFALQHSVGNKAGGSEVDVPIIYADYYYVEALMRRLAIAKE